MKINSIVVVILIIGFTFIITGITIALLYEQNTGAYFISIGLAALAASFYFTLFSLDNRKKSEAEEENKNNL